VTRKPGQIDLVFIYLASLRGSTYSCFVFWSTMCACVLHQPWTQLDCMLRHCTTPIPWLLPAWIFAISRIRGHNNTPSAYIAGLMVRCVYGQPHAVSCCGMANAA